MGLTAIGNSGNYVTDAQTTPSVASPAVTHSISLSIDTVDFAVNGTSDTTEPSNALSLFSVLNANILDYNNLSGVGSAIDTYTQSLSNSNLYQSSYTAPSATFLHDLDNVKSAAALGDTAAASSALAIAKLDAPDNVAGGIALAKAKGDVAGESGLLIESTANISDFLGTQGYTAVAAKAEASAITINGLTTNATTTASFSVQTRLQQISGLALYAADQASSIKHGTPSDSNDPLFDIVSTLLGATSEAATSQDIISLYNKYITHNPDVSHSNT